MVRKVRALTKTEEDVKAKYVYAMPRPGHGYNPGDRVPGKFAEQHPWAVRLAENSGEEKQTVDATKQSGGEK